MVDIIGGAGFVGTGLSNSLAGLQRVFKILDLVVSETHCEASVLADIRNKEGLTASLTGGPVVDLAAVHRDDIRPLSRYDDVNV